MRFAITGSLSCHCSFIFYPLCLDWNSLFDFQRYEAETNHTDTSVFREQSNLQSSRSNKRTVKIDGAKSEKSFINFVQHNPNFIGDVGSKSMVEKLQLFKELKYSWINFNC